MMKIVAQNRRARFDYQIDDTVLAGLILTGQEVKSCRMSHVDLAGSYVSFLGGKPLIKHLKIQPYPFASQLDGYDPGRDRFLLLNKSEIAKLESAAAGRGVTIVPLEVQAGKTIKVLIGIAHGRKTIDKRQVIKDRDMKKKLHKGEEV
jgi:SsrA-binding protein